MRSLLNCFILTFSLWLLSATSSAGEPRQLRVLSYNIHHGEGVDGKLDLERIADVILSVKPDLVALQEVDQNVQRSGNVDQAAELAKLTEMQSIFAGNIELQGGHYGNAVLSRFPMERHTNHRLPNFENGEQRGVLEIEVSLPGANQSLIFFATHFDHRRAERERLASAAAINELVLKQPQAAALLAGDLNATPESETLGRIQSAWTRANARPMATIPVNQPTRQIDFVLFRPAERWKTVEVQVLDEAVASDHRAILAVLEFIPEAE